MIVISTRCWIYPCRGSDSRAYNSATSGGRSGKPACRGRRPLLWLHGGAGQQLRRRTGVSLQLSIIIPALNEPAVSWTSCAKLQALRQQGHEVILVDGGSTMRPHRAGRWSIGSVPAAGGRALQMNIGACCSTGEILFFLHADTCVPAMWMIIGNAIGSHPGGGVLMFL